MLKIKTNSVLTIDKGISVNQPHDVFLQSVPFSVDEQKLEERFRINRRELIPLEFPVLVALEMGLYLPESKVMPHYRRLVQQG